MARAQGTPPVHSPALLGKLKPLQTPTVGFLSPHSVVEPYIPGSFTVSKEKENHFGYNSPDLLYLSPFG